MTETPPPADPPAGGPTDPPANPSADAPADHTLAYGAPPDAPGPSGRSGRRGLAIGAVAAVLAVVAGAAVYATTALSGGGRQPDELVPRSAFAYLKVDLDPAAGQKLAARSFFGRFPALKGATGDTNAVFDNLLDEATKGGDGISFANDVKPWFDRRAAVAAYPGSGGVAVVAVLRSKDDAQARTALDRVKARPGTKAAYTIAKGYVVIGETQAVVDDAVRQAGQASLRDNATYRGDVARLDGDQVAVGWADLAQSLSAGLSATPGGGGGLLGGVTGLVKGRVVAGLHLAGDYAEVTGFTVGADQRLVPRSGDPTVLKGLPASTVAAVSFNDLGTTLKTALATAGAGGLDPMALLGGFLGQTGISVNDVLPLLGSQTVLALGSAFDGLDSIRAGLVSKLATTAAAENGRRTALALEQLGLPVKAQVRGDTFYLATGDYAGELASGSGLGATPKFTKAMGDVGSVSFAAYADLETLLAGRAGAGEKPLRALGIVGGVRDGQAFFRVRLTVD